MEIDSLRTRHAAWILCYLLLCLSIVAASRSRYAVYRQMIVDGVDTETINEAIMRDALYRFEIENRRDPSKSHRSPSTGCTIKIEAGPIDQQGDDPDIEAKVECSGKTIHEETTPLSKLKQVNLAHVLERLVYLMWTPLTWEVCQGIKLFAKTGPEERAYLLIDSSNERVTITDPSIKNLPMFPGNMRTAAPIVLRGQIEIKGGEIFHNKGHKTGGIIFEQKCLANLFDTNIYDNSGESGAMVVKDQAVVMPIRLTIEANNGSIVGAVLVEGEGSVFSPTSTDFYDNLGIESAAAILYHAESNGILVDCVFGSHPREDNLKEFLLDKNSDMGQLGAYKLPKAGAVEVKGRTVLSFNRCKFENQSALYGSVVMSEAAVVQISASNIDGSLALNGGGIFVDGSRGSYARMMHSNFTNNVARNGGAVVGKGNGSYVFYDCIFNGNRAIRGGVIWGDYADDLTNGNCLRAAQGSRMTVNQSTFTDNKAEESGGAIFLTCTDIETRHSSFSGNSAGEDGGSIYLRDVYDLALLKSKFRKNTAGRNGGSIFLRNSHDLIISKSTVFTDNVAKHNGGAVYSEDGHGIIVTDSDLSRNAADNDGGAIHGHNITGIIAHRATIAANTARINGGAMAIDGLERMELEKVDLTDNTATEAGGAVSAKNGLSAVVKSIHIYEINSGKGSISLENVDHVSVSDIDFSDNKASTCGSLNIDKASKVDLKNLQFVRNEATEKGGGVCLMRADSVEMSNVLFHQNVAPNGGAIYLEENRDITMLDTSFDENYGTQRGGAIQGFHIERLQLQFTTFQRNGAGYRGAAVYLEKSSLNFSMSDLENNYVGEKRKSMQSEHEVEAEGSLESIDEWGFEEFEEREGIIPAATENINEPGGVVVMLTGKEFVSHKTKYVHSEGREIGGALMLTNLVTAKISASVFEDGRAELKGGCVYARNVQIFNIEDSNLTDCHAQTGGALMFEGYTRAVGNYNRITNSTANSGGALLCSGPSDVKMEQTYFFYNSAKEGGTAATTCSCHLSFDSSLLYRDPRAPNNGYILHEERKCSSISLNNCKLYGDRKSNGMGTAGVIGIVMTVSLFSLCVLWVMAIAIRRRRRNRRQNDIEDPTAPLISPPISASKKKQTVVLTDDSSDYDSEDDDDDEDTTESDDDTSEEEIAHRKQHVPSKHRQAARKMRDVSEDEEESTEEEEIGKGSTTPFDTTGPSPIGLRNPKEKRAVERHRRASVGQFNDGAGPSGTSFKRETLPPKLPPRFELSLSMDQPNPQVPIQDPPVEGTQ